jgi:putative (di)nucleoside polyphosphate hydrolase
MASSPTETMMQRCLRSMNENELKYRANVAGILRDSRGKILICERLGVRDAWQFPQGGVDPGETSEQALARELWEEVSVEAVNFRIVRQQGPYRYLYGEGRMKKGYHGKEQIYFLCDFLGPENGIDVRTKHPEFRSYRWIHPVEFQSAWLPDMKREVYRAVFAHFFGVEIR